MSIVMSPRQYQQMSNHQDPRTSHGRPPYHVSSPVNSRRDVNPIAWSYNYFPINPVIQQSYPPYYNMPYPQHSQQPQHPQAMPNYGNLAAAHDPSVLCYSCGTNPGNGTYPFAYYPTQFGGMPEYYPQVYHDPTHHAPIAPNHFQQGPVAAVPPLEHRRNSCSSSASIGAPHTPSMSSTCVETPSIVGETIQGLTFSPSSDRFISLQNGSKNDKQTHTRQRTGSQSTPHGKNSLYNPSKTTNVYVRGLAPDTDDEKLLKLVQPFGKTVSCKSIIDKGTGLCKGYGFALFESMDEAKSCILGMAKVNLDAGFARESFNSRLKSLGDPSSTNLYVSNLPSTVDEAQMTGIFKDFPVMSVRILLDAQGASRGVGFIRFASHQTCDQVIAQFNDKEVFEGRSAIQVRYADTYAQKTLKDATTKVREFYCEEQKKALASTQKIPTGPKITGGKKWAPSMPRSSRPTGERTAPPHPLPQPPVVTRFQAAIVPLGTGSDNGSVVTAIPSTADNEAV
ncbi:hypothetical protein DFH27DRAFT_263309 [Peziza echinospora]|nr:hypothetical protein DFH27DRAFT_263309 [Peziza echinospora]